jgi:hypothetical protein
VLAILGKEGLIGREMFAIDGVKLPSNASKHRSGTRADFLARARKLERAAKAMLDRHRANDDNTSPEDPNGKGAARIERMKREAAQIRAWLATVDCAKSNLTDNESAKLATDKGVMQGYSGVAVVDAAHQIIVEAQAHGTGAEQELLLPMLEACAEQMDHTTLITADAGHHSEANLAALSERHIDALIADPGMRRRDERYAGQERHSASLIRCMTSQPSVAAANSSRAMTSSSPQTTAMRPAPPGGACTATERTASLGATTKPSSSVHRSARAAVASSEQSVCAIRRPLQAGRSPCSRNCSE